MRLDKLLEELQFGSRKTVKRLIKGKGHCGWHRDFK